jgi:hypothetical protein
MTIDTVIEKAAEKRSKLMKDISEHNVKDVVSSEKDVKGKGKKKAKPAKKGGKGGKGGKGKSKK